MNDPGLDKPVDDASRQVRENIEHPQHDHGPDDQMDEEDEERSFSTPARWWYASTGFPLIAGTFGPMANAFSICALVEDWRVEIPPGGTEEHGIPIDDPSWLIAINAVSLVCALAANMALLLNMARRVPFRIAQPVTIVGFWTASLLLIALIAVAAHDFHAPGVRDQALSQAYYYAIFAAALYQLIAYLMCVTVYGAYVGHYGREFKLTVPQRTLMLQTISFLAYQLLGALVFSHVEGWMYLDAVYWADFTLLTVGIGADYVPRTHLGRGLLFPFAIGGIVILGLVVGSIRSLVLDRGKVKMAARLTEKTRARLVRDVDRAVSARRRRRGVMGLSAQTAQALAAQPGDGAMDERDRRKAEFAAMRKVQQRAATERKYFSLFVSAFAFAFLWTIGALIFFYAERNQQWTYFASLYFAYTSLLTIGYGDYQPISNSGKPFFVFWSLLAIPTLTILISNMGDTVVKGVKDLTIWLGEVTVLPSNDASTRSRLRHGLVKATLGTVKAHTGRARDVKQGSDSDSQSSFQELHPGLAKAFRRRGAKGAQRRERKTQDRLAADWEQSERLDESVAHSRREKWEEDEHHYRHMLISQIRKVYADTAAATPKTYSYGEWCEFLRLLGEDESDASFHRRALATHRHRGSQALSRRDDSQGSRGQEDDKDHGGNRDGDRNGGEGDGSVTRWSWIGTRSPLLGDKDEAEWLLEKFFERLEESLRREMERRGRGPTPGPTRPDDDNDNDHDVVTMDRPASGHGGLNQEE